jgi:hypothetical protein
MIARLPKNLKTASLALFAWLETSQAFLFGSCEASNLEKQTASRYREAEPFMEFFSL